MRSFAEGKRKGGTAALASIFPCDQPFVTTGGGGALGDLPEHAPRLSTASEAKMKTSSFLIELPRFSPNDTCN